MRSSPRWRSTARRAGRRRSSGAGPGAGRDACAGRSGLLLRLRDVLALPARGVLALSLRVRLPRGLACAGTRSARLYGLRLRLRLRLRPRLGEDSEPERLRLRPRSVGRRSAGDARPLSPK